jgi:DNA primase
LISPSTIQQIIEASRIEEVIGDFVVLKRRGTNLISLCPFHTEKTPSFHVSPVKGIYKCFGCGKAGNAVNFLMEHEHYNYPEALRYLAKKYSIEIEETEATPEQEQAADERETLYNILAFAQKYFTETLLETEEGKAIGLTYFNERGFSQQTITKFQLGYSTDNWENFSRHAVESGYNPELLVKAGLSAVRSSEFRVQSSETAVRDNLYDIYRGRVIFPIHNLSGRVIGFGGRILSSDKKKPKYINSPESDIYHKSEVLYGIYFAKNAIIKNDNCYLVEGYTDVISLHQSGIENVVASSGTSLTAGQIKLIKRYTPNITILYDGDEAGIKASFRGIDMILEEGLNVRVVLFPDGEDPDSFARKHRPQEVDDFIKASSADFITFKTGLLLKETGDDPVRKSSLIKEMLNSISLIPDVITRTEYIKECGRLMNISEQTLINELNKILSKKVFSRQSSAVSRETAPEPTEYIAEKQIPVEEDIFESQEKELIRLLLQYSDTEIVFQMEDENDERPEKRFIYVKYKVWDFIADNLKDDTDINGENIKFNNPVYQKIFEEVMSISLQSTVHSQQIKNNSPQFTDDSQQMKNNSPQSTDDSPQKIDLTSRFLNHADEYVRTTAIDILTSPYTFSRNWMNMHKIHTVQEEDKYKLSDSVRMAVLTLKLKRVTRNIEDVKNKLKVNILPNEEENYMKLLVNMLGNRNIIAAELSRPVLK